MSIEVFIPFPGFYESWLSQELDSILENELDEYPDRSWEDYQYNIQQVAQEYLEVYWSKVEEALDDAGYPPFLWPIHFKELISPREYNFETDRVLAEYQGSPNDLLLVYAVLENIQNLGVAIHGRFASRSGFISFYSDFVDEWQDTPLGEWDANELSVLLPDLEWDDLLEDLRESLYDCVEYIGESE